MPDPLHPWGYAILLGFLAIGYLIGSIPFGLVFSRLFGLPDPRSYGSHNIGATNILRSGNKLAALLTLIGDSGKGWLITFLSLYFYGLDAAIATGFGAFMGHLHPIFLGFKGGKGVATFLGVHLAFSPTLVGPLSLVGWLLGAIISKRSSVGALTIAVLAPLTFWWFTYIQLSEVSAIMAAWMLWRHRDNIRRLYLGQEPKMNFQRSREN